MAALPVRADWLKLYKELLRAGREVFFVNFKRVNLLFFSFLSTATSILPVDVSVTILNTRGLRI